MINLQIEPGDTVAFISPYEQLNIKSGEKIVVIDFEDGHPEGRMIKFDHHGRTGFWLYEHRVRLVSKGIGVGDIVEFTSIPPSVYPLRLGYSVMVTAVKMSLGEPYIGFLRPETANETNWVNQRHVTLLKKHNPKASTMKAGDTVEFIHDHDNSATRAGWIPAGGRGVVDKVSEDGIAFWFYNDEGRSDGAYQHQVKIIPKIVQVVEPNNAWMAGMLTYSGTLLAGMTIKSLYTIGMVMGYFP